MPAIIETRALADAMSRAIKAVKTRNTIPILDNVLLSASGGKLSITTTDMDVRIETSVACEGDMPAVTAPARRLYDLARGYPGGSQTKIDIDGEHAVVSCGRSRAKLLTLPADDFPNMETGKFAKVVDMDLRSIVDQVRFAASTEESRYYLNGMFLTMNGGVLDAVATDGHRLARLRFAPPDEFNLDAGRILPNYLLPMIPEGVVKFAFSDTKIKIRAGETTITSKLIDGTFPDYERVIPRDLKNEVTFDRAAMLSAIKRLDGLANDLAGNPMRFAVSDGMVTVEVKNPQVGVVTDEIEAEANGDIVVGFNTSYLVDFLTAADGDRVTMRLSESMGLVQDDEMTLVQMAQRVAG